MVKFLSNYAKWIIAVFGLLVFGLTQTPWLTNSELWQKAEGALIDRRFLLRGDGSPDPNIQLVGLGTSAFQLDKLSPEEIAASPTLQLMQQPWPWNRRVYAAILDRLMDAGAKVVMFDFVFASETEGDDVFAQSLLKHKNHVVIGEMFADEKGSDSKTKKLTTPNARLLLPGTESVAGLVNIWTDPDAIARRARYRTSDLRETLETPDMVAAIDPKTVAYLKQQINTGKIPDDLMHITARAVEKFKGSIDTPPPEKKTFINFQGPAGTFRPWPVEEMFAERVWNGGGRGFNGGLVFSNKIVIVGPTAEIFHDVHTTPFGETPGPEVQAQIMAALLHSSWLEETSPRVNLALALGLLALALVICLWIDQALWKVFLLAGAAVFFFIACQLVFTREHIVVAMMQPLFCLIATGSFGIVFQYALEQFERLRYRNVLDRYVSANVAKAILEDTRSLEESMRGKKKPVTILFSDIRGFTTMTEKSDAEKLVAQLNEYFSEMVGVIQDKNQGTLQKFIGDAIMAGWGDTHSNGIDVDARRAVTAALEMRAALVRLNSGWGKNPDRIQLATGIGVNHGEVIYGNIGAQQRMELTVLGDGVNLAARLESATKQFHTDILIGGTVEALTRAQFIYRNVGAIAFKGKTQPVETFLLLSDHSQPPPAWLAKYHEAVKLYRGREFKRAGELFQTVAREIGGADYLCEMYVAHCEACLKEPPPQDWDGSFTLSEK